MITMINISTSRQLLSIVLANISSKVNGDVYNDGTRKIFVT